MHHHLDGFVAAGISSIERLDFGFEGGGFGDSAGTVNEEMLVSKVGLSIEESRRLADWAKEDVDLFGFGETDDASEVMF